MPKKTSNVKKIYLRFSHPDEDMDPNYFIYSKEQQAISEQFDWGYKMSFCKREFESITGIKLKKGEVIELSVKQGKKLRKVK